MILLDLFCGAGGAAMGYHRAGFEVVGVDIRKQPRYPFEFHQEDALQVLGDMIAAPSYGWWGGRDLAALHASPPCQAYSTVTQRNQRNQRKEYPDLIAPTRERLMAQNLPWVIENVRGAPISNPLRLCGSMFGLDVERHRLFESSHLLMLPSPCRHDIWERQFRSLDSRQKTLAKVVGVHGHVNYAGEFALRQKAMGIDWMTNEELTQAIPPAYTEWIGTQLLASIRTTA